MINRETRGRVEIPVHYDTWMRGARFGTIIGFRFGKPAQSDYLLIQMDHPQIKKFLKLWEPDWPYTRMIKESKMNIPTFRARYLRDGSTALHCKQTDVRYIITQAGVDHAAYRNGELIRTGTRCVCVDAVESDARWGMRGLA